MALTYTYADLLSMIKTYPKAVEDHFAPIVCNLATSLIWHAFDWRASLVALPPFYLVPGEQDHYLPPAIIPSNFHGLRKVELCQYTSGGVNKHELVPLKDLQLTHIKRIPSAISYEASISGFRLHPRVPENMGPPHWFIEGTYKSRPTKITNTTLNTLLPFDDQYLYVWIDTMQWAYDKVSRSPNAGQVQMNGPQVLYTGQLANAMASISAMAENEGFNDGDAQISPGTSLTAGFGRTTGYYNIFGM